MGLSEGSRFAGYTVLKLLGSGGMGEVYLAKHPRLPRMDALKILPLQISTVPDYRQRFLREADLASTLWHPHIVGVHDRGEFEGQFWISMDFVDGTDAGCQLKNRYPTGMPAERVASIITAVAGALDYAHSKGLLHRDVKPANIMLANADDIDQRVLLTDFGIARSMNDVGGLTATNLTMGTVAYAAPEQLMGENLDGRTDQYALAATAFHLLTGSQLFPHSNPAVVISQHLNRPPPPVSSLRPDLHELDQVLARALAKKPTDRYRRCGDFANDFAQKTATAPEYEAMALTRPARAARSDQRAKAIFTTYLTGKRLSKRNRLALLTAIAIVATAGPLAVFATVHHSKSSRAVTAATPGDHSILDGTYRLTYDGAKQLQNGAPEPWANQSEDMEVHYWALKSRCNSSGCLATGTALDRLNQQVARTPARTVELRLRDGRWEELSHRESVDQPLCLYPDKRLAPGSDTEVREWTLDPQPDGTLRGLQTTTVLTNECGLQGTLVQVPFSAIRVGELPPNVQVADPSTVSVISASAPAVSNASTMTLDGVFRIDIDYQNQTVNGRRLAKATVPNNSSWWAYRSVCGDTGCVATGVELNEKNHLQGSGIAGVLRFTDGRWQDEPYLQPPRQCPGDNLDSDVSVISRSLIPELGGSLRGFESMTILTNQCGDQGTIYQSPIEATRTGDVPPTVIIADPARFLPGN